MHDISEWLLSNQTLVQELHGNAGKFVLRNPLRNSFYQSKAHIFHKSETTEEQKE